MFLHKVRVAALVRYAGQPQETGGKVAHSQGNYRWAITLYHDPTVTAFFQLKRTGSSAFFQKGAICPKLCPWRPVMLNLL